MHCCKVSDAVPFSFEVGLITFLLGIFRLGFLDAVLSRALLRGFITAIGFVILIEQLSMFGSHTRRLMQIT